MKTFTQRSNCWHILLRPFVYPRSQELNHIFGRNTPYGLTIYSSGAAERSSRVLNSFNHISLVVKDKGMNIQFVALLICEHKVPLTIFLGLFVSLIA
jgi:hypothetical protein